MATSSEYMEARQKYINLKNDAQAVLDNLNNCQSFLSVCSGKLTKGISADGEGLDNNKVQDMDTNVQDMKTKLNVVIIPALTAKINELGQKAQAAAAREKAEAEAEAERERKQREEANASSRNN